MMECDTTVLVLRKAGKKIREIAEITGLSYNEVNYRLLVLAKIHGLGYTSLDGIRINHFDSVDSTAWTTGNRFGYLYYFDGKTMQKRDAPKGRRLADPKKAAINNYIEWIKFQQYADKNL